MKKRKVGRPKGSVKKKAIVETSPIGFVIKIQNGIPYKGFTVPTEALKYITDKLGKMKANPVKDQEEHFDYPKTVHNTFSYTITKLHKQKNGPAYRTKSIGKAWRRLWRIK